MIIPVESVREIARPPQLVPLQLVKGGPLAHANFIESVLANDLRSEDAVDNTVIASQIILAQLPPLLIKTKGKIYPITLPRLAKPYWHANQHASLMVGTVSAPVEALRSRHLIHLENNNPKVRAVSFPDFMPNISYHGGLSPNARLLVYPRSHDTDTQKDTDVMEAILKDIARWGNLKLINISGKLTVTPSIASLLNILAERGKIIVQATGNDGKNLALPENAVYQSMTFVDGASIDDLSDNFWRHHIWVGALSCFKNENGELAVERWTRSSYYLDAETAQHNFIFAPGAGILAASYNKYTLESGTGSATALVTSALALFLEANPNSDAATITKQLLKNVEPIAVDDERKAIFSVLNIEKLLN
jgi:subtilisin family serine protease